MHSILFLFSSSFIGAAATFAKHAEARCQQMGVANDDGFARSEGVP